ncbi:hypothetical protein AAVH_01725 [Aphelenchoides avenae]|nr:hypothetical protein AAVH_01725 [Aphelenchus avenae]
MTDVNADVLHQLAKNVSLNFGDAENVSAGELDWADYDLSQLPAVPEVILAAGMVLRLLT